jgi:hypothetical protein
MNSMTKIFPGLASLLVLSALPLQAQMASSSQIPPPHAPFVIPVPEKAQWTIVLTPEKAAKKDTSSENTASATLAAPPSIQLTQIHSIRDGKIKHDLFTYSNGKTRETWYYNNFILKLNSSGNDVMVLNGSIIDFTPDHYPNLSAAYLRRGNLEESFGFPGLTWIDLKYYDNVVTHDKKPCYHYALTEESKVIAEAWIDVKTGYPVAYQADGSIYTFTFDETSASLTLPTPYADAISRQKKMADQMRQLEKDAGVR